MDVLPHLGVSETLKSKQALHNSRRAVSVTHGVCFSRRMVPLMETARDSRMIASPKLEATYMYLCKVSFGP